MSIATDQLPLTETVTPEDQSALVAAMEAACASRTPMYPIGGGTSLNYGVTARVPGLGLALERLNRVVDYPARDMTITVEPGITLVKLTETLAAERQWLPIDAPQPEQATLGGLVATAFNGPRRYGWGTIRDYVIGISAIDGRGVPFKGGGRVVKNVAGYDFCKLLTGSLGTLGVISQVTLKIRPLPEQSVLVACEAADLAMAERLLARMVDSATTPAAIELLAGPAWNDEPALGAASSGDSVRLVVGLEGTAAELEWMAPQLTAEWRECGAASIRSIDDSQASDLWARLREFPADAESPLVVKASLVPSAVCGYVQLLREIDPHVSIQAHAGNGIVIARFAVFPSGEISRKLIGRLQPAAAARGGHVIVLSSNGLGELTRQAVWGGAAAATAWMTKVKQQFDPHGLLNPGRFVYGSE